MTHTEFPAIIAEILSRFACHNNLAYGEAVTRQQHALQTTPLDIEAGLNTAAS